VADPHFTVEEANALLGTVRPLVEQMVARRRELGAALDRRQELDKVTGSNGGGLDPHEPAEIDEVVENAAQGLEHCIRELTALGVQVKDVDLGLVDFPPVRDGEEVLPAGRSARTRSPGRSTAASTRGPL
jgi:hypothetical protein